MFSDIGPLEVVALVVMAIVIFGPDKLPKLIQDTMGFIRKVRSFADSAKDDIRSELGPEFQDFEFTDLHPKTFVRKQLMGGNEDPLGFKELKDGLDFKSALNDEPPRRVAATPDLTKSAPAETGAPLAAGERPPFDLDAT
ncbi:sec-independent translocase [Kitasatospora sp. DSM 101779]|uniref:sec-independent translocase n=1 Tax=Kitasatospora sp. DSM 101779 TaxID=2853165 RepID=UPI0021DADCB7|nr:sec-independent translocase [Kitasatospora sp. DSM 101779]MCU7822996.1 Sec-independent protein translocase subunit TatB [Kitasatospora sp. DSM 101779]